MALGVKDGLFGAHLVIRTKVKGTEAKPFTIKGTWQALRK